MVQRCGLDRALPVLVGVSGGADSLTLLDILCQSGYPVVVAHVNHQLRASAGQDADRVQAVAAQYGMPFRLGLVNVGEYAAAHHLSIEEAARILRYRFLGQTAQEVGAQALAVGHTADDQVETVLMHLLRGAGLAGLAGMRYRSQIPDLLGNLPVVRPLLGVWRKETEAHCCELGIQPVQDETNQDVRYERNRIRLEIIPALEKTYPHLKENLWRTAQVLAGDEEALRVYLDEQLMGETVEWGDCYAALDRVYWRMQPVGMQRRVIRRAGMHLRPTLRDVGFDAVERALRFFHQPSESGSADWLDGMVLEQQGRWMLIREADAQVLLKDEPQVTDSAAQLPIPGRIHLSDGWQLTAEEFPADEAILQQARKNSDPNTAYLDADRVRRPLGVRGFLSGDRMQPLGMKDKTIKISDLYTNLKIPRAARAGVPLVISGDEILWVGGYRLAD
ncbi:MAG: tRNA lysidine(34) synthetase TilS, partial [Anaerolineaceae bacterium]